jgi:RimJ/RimL family protein N-acetyltransferase
MKALLKKLAHLLLGEYAAYYVYTHPCAAGPVPPSPFAVRPVDADQIRAADDALLRAQAFYAGEGALTYACMDGTRMVGLCCYWHGERYRPRGFWPLRADEAKLVQIVTASDMRGRKVARAMLDATLPDVARHGFARAYARVWHSNTPSLRAFEGAGWQRVALVVELNPLRRRQPWRLRMDSARR